MTPNQTKSGRRLLLLELNEFNEELLYGAAEAYGCRNIQRLKSFHRSSTFTEDQTESGYLEPWVQWVSVHTGVDSGAHGIKHLGDVSVLAHPQIWERLSDMGITCGVWGALNAVKGNADKCLFFLPDPWTFSESGFPSELNSYLDFPRYLARNYLGIKFKEIFRVLPKFIRFFLSPECIPALLKETPRVGWNMLRYRRENFVAYSCAEYLSTLRFLEYRRRHQPQFTVLFLNLIAHAQHYFWHDDDFAANKRLRYVFRYLDLIIGKVLSSLQEDDDLIVINALSQKSVKHDKPWYLYRPYDHKVVLTKMGVPPSRVEALMTNDAHIFYPDLNAADQALRTLAQATVCGHQLFTVERDHDDPLKIFYAINYTGAVPEGHEMSFGTKSMPFFQNYKKIVQRTGSHTGNGTALATRKILPDKLANHEIFAHIVSQLT